MQLRRRKQILLEGLAASLQLSESADHGGGRELSDLVFLRLVSLPKGRKLIARYLQLLPRGSDLSRTVVLAIMRHLRFLFGGAHADPGTATSLAGSVAAAISSLDLAALSACLATALGAVEYPPLRPLRSVNGDGATVVLLAVLDRASVVLSGQEGGPPPSAMAQEIWQSNFDSFFGLLAKHCSAKFEAIAAAAEAGGGMNAAAAAAIGAEVPVELLRSSLPHTNDNQRAFLLDTIRKTVAAGGFAHGGRDMQPNTATVHG
jgi:DNA topoisomerase 2-associated protein PAT1